MSFIPGMTGIISGGGGASSLTSVVESLTTATSNVIAWPSVVAGDVMVLVDAAENDQTSASSPISKVIPTGFTEITWNDDQYTYSSPVVLNHTLVVSYKIAVGTESGTITGMGGDLAHKHLFRYRGGNRAINSVSVSTWNSAFGANPALQTVVAGATSQAQVVMGCVSGAPTRNFTSVSPAFESTSSLSGDMGGSLGFWYSRVGRIIYDSGESRTSSTLDSDGRAILLSGYIAFS